jgi:hypothetical protein
VSAPLDPTDAQTPVERDAAATLFACRVPRSGDRIARMERWRQAVTAQAREEIAARRVEVEARRAERAALLPLARLGRWALDRVRPYAFDLDGSSVQHQAIRFGALETVRVSEPCRADPCPCAEIGLPMSCVRDTPATQHARRILDAEAR